MKQNSNKYKSLKRLFSGYYTRKDAESVFEYIKHDTDQAKADFDQISDEFWENSECMTTGEEEKIIYYRKEARDLLGNRKHRKYFLMTYLRLVSVAAVLLLILATGYWTFLKDSTSHLHDLAFQALEKTQVVENVQLTLSDEKTVLLEGKEPVVQYDNSGSIIVNQELKEEKKVVVNPKYPEVTAINSIVVPVGKRSVLTLSDGSKVWVNSDSKVVFPTVFEASKREIFVDGEVYLDVAPDKEKPFFVNTKDMSIRVLGTSFNVTAYSTDKEQSVVLVHGSVQVKAGNEKYTRMVPNDRFSYRNGQSDLRPVNVNSYISWKDGFCQYESERIDAIVTRLSRYYGITVLCEEEVGAYTCSGKLDLKENITDVLQSLSKTAPVKYEQVSDGYILKRK